MPSRGRQWFQGPVRWAIMVLAAGLAGCSGLGYQDAIGYRARQAALRGDASVFPGLMAEAAEAEPKSRLDNPKKTVLTHFLDLAASPEFLPTVEDWNERAWVDEDMVCPVYRAHFAAHHRRDPAAAAHSAQVCMDRARRAAPRPDRTWEVDLCLLEAPFLVQTSTPSLQPYIETALDPAEPERLRQGLLRGLTYREHFGPRKRWGRTSTVTADVRRQLAHDEARDWARRLRGVLDTLEGQVPATELAIASARGALEVEQVFQGLGRSFIAGFADSPRPEHRAWAWAWVRSLKHAERVPHLAALGLWDRGREPAKDAYWYLCTAPPEAQTSRTGRAKVAVSAVSVRTDQPLDDAASELAPSCPVRDRVFGPYPLEQTARFAATERIAQAVEPGTRVLIRIQRRVAPSRDAR